MLDSNNLSNLLVGFTLVYVLWRRFRAHLESKKPYEGLPMVPNSHFLLGHMGLLGIPFQRYFQILSDNANENGHTGYWVGSTATIAVHNWEDARKVHLNETYRKSVPILTRHLNRFVGKYNILNLI